MFEAATGAVRLAEGTIVIGDDYGTTIRYFDSTGDPVGTVGRSGKGPGEFGGVWWVGRCGGDTVFVWDNSLGRMSVIASSRRVIRQFRIPADSVGAGPPALFACNGGGPIAIMTPDFASLPMRPTSSATARGVLALADRDGHILRAVDTTAMGQIRPLPRTTQITLSSDNLFVGTEDSATVTRYALGSGARRELSVGIMNRAVSDREYERAIDRQVAMLTAPADRASMKKHLLGIPKPPSLPPYFALFAVGHDTLWAQVSAPGESVTVLDAVGPDGKPVGEARIPRDLQVLDMGRDYILGEYDAPDGEQHVALYRMHPPS